MLALRTLVLQSQVLLGRGRRGPKRRRANGAARSAGRRVLGQRRISRLCVPVVLGQGELGTSCPSPVRSNTGASIWTDWSQFEKDSLASGGSVDWRAAANCAGENIAAKLQQVTRLLLWAHDPPTPR